MTSPSPRYSRTCEWLQGCTERGLLYEYTNALGDKVRHAYCDKHAAAMQDPEQQLAALYRVANTMLAVNDRLGAQMDPRALANHPAQVALLAHQQECARCRDVRQWIVNEGQLGNIATAADVDRIGQYVVDNCCPQGVALNHAVGMAMQELRT